MIRAGDLRHQVRIEVRVATQDAAGEQYLNWQTFAQVMASMQRVTGRELFASAERQGRVQTVFRLRYLAGITPAMRLVLLSNNAVYDIVSAVDQEGRKAEIVLTAEEHVDEQAGPDGGPYVPPITTIAAANVTVTPTGNLASTNAQAALEEHQGDLDGINAQLVDASDTQRGLVSTFAQTFAGLKTFVAGIALQAKLAITGVASGSNAIEIPSGSRLSFNGSSTDVQAYYDGTRVRLTKPIQPTGGPAVPAVYADMGGATNTHAFSAVNLGGGTGGGIALGYSSSRAIGLGGGDGGRAQLFANNWGLDLASNSGGDIQYQGTRVPSSSVHKFGCSGGALQGGDSIASWHENNGAAMGASNAKMTLASNGHLSVTGSFTAPYSYMDTLYARTGGYPINLVGLSTDSANAKSVVLNTNGAFTTVGAKILSAQNNGTEKAFINKDGEFEVVDAGKGVILKSPNGTRYKITVTDAGALNVAAA